MPPVEVDMAKGKFDAWLRPEKLEQITNWAAKGCTQEEIASNMGIHRKTLEEWVGRFDSIASAIKDGRAMSIVCIEDMAFKVAMGLVEEEQMVKVKTPDGGERVEMRKRRLPPNTAMLIFLLKNRAGYRDNPPEEMGADVLAKVDGVLRAIEDQAR